MKKRLLSSLLVLALCLSLCLAPGTFSTRAQAADDTAALPPAAAKAFAAILRDTVSLYGTCAAAPAYDSAGSNYGYSAAGLAYADLLDFDGDGVPELYFYRTGYGGKSGGIAYLDGTVYEEIWQWNGSGAVQVRSEEHYSNASHMGHSGGRCLYREGGKVYLSNPQTTSGHSGGARTCGFLTLQNGSWISWHSIREEWNCAVLGSYDQLDYTLTIDGSVIVNARRVQYDEAAGFPSDSAADVFYARYPLSEEDHLIAAGAYAYLNFRVNDAAGLLTRLEQRAVEIETITKPADALAGLAYIGNRAKCALKPQVAQAYAAALEQWVQSDDDSSRGTPVALLVDVGGDGVPLLVRMKVSTDTPSGTGYTADNLAVLEYRDGKARSHDFTADWAQASGNTVYFHGMTVYTTDGASGCLVADNIPSWATSFGITGVELFYTAQGGALTLAGWRTQDRTDAYDSKTGMPVLDVRTSGPSGKNAAPNLDALNKTVFIDSDYSFLKDIDGSALTSAAVAAKTLRIYAEAAAPKVSVGGVRVPWSDAVPFIDANNRTLVPLRAVGDALGLTVGWNAKTREASFTDGTKTVYFPIGSSKARTETGAVIQMDTAAVIVSDRTYAPVRALAEYFGRSVGWDAKTRTVLIQ